MIRDTYATFCTLGDVSNAAATINVGSSIDTWAGGSSPNNLNTLLNNGTTPIYLRIQCDGGASGIITGGSAGTIQFRLVSDAIDVPDTSTATVHWTSEAFVTDDAALNAIDLGTVIANIVLPTEKRYERYLGVQAIIATTTTTEGTITAFLTPLPAITTVYADNVG